MYIACGQLRQCTCIIGLDGDRRVSYLMASGMSCDDMIDLSRQQVLGSAPVITYYLTSGMSCDDMISRRFNLHPSVPGFRTPSYTDPGSAPVTTHDDSVGRRG